MQIKYDKSNCPAFGLYNARVPCEIVALWKKYDERVLNLATCLSSGMKILPEKFYGKFSSRDFSCPNRLDVKRGPSGRNRFDIRVKIYADYFWTKYIPIE